MSWFSQFEEKHDDFNNEGNDYEEYGGGDGEGEGEGDGYYGDYGDYGDDSDYNNDDKNNQPENKYFQSYGEKQHSSEHDDCGIYSIPQGDKKWDETFKKLNYMNINPLDRFKKSVGIISYRLNGNEKEGTTGILNISREDRNKMCLLANQLPNVKYLNPTAFILGYYVTKGGTTEIDKKLFDDVVKNKLNKIDDNSVKAPDIIRYARFIINKNN